MRYLLLIITILLHTSLAAQKQNCWPSFRGNPELSGTTDVELPPIFELSWTFKTGDVIKSSAVICNNTIFIGSNDGFVYALNFDGSLKWKFDAETSVEAPPLYLDNTIFAGSLEGVLFALDAKSGSEKWRFTTGGQISGAAGWAWGTGQKSKNIFVGSYDFFLHAIDAQTGDSLWKYESDNYINGAVATNGKSAVFGGCDGN
ncbi:MAG: PQQ-binding-like beta-propeller repeat protein, partial [Bacteroidales bacterium]|nr:PQQ-binding-like beta-propeller repeat protein [Bacteroidales bacterium]